MSASRSAAMAVNTCAKQTDFRTSEASAHVRLAQRETPWLWARIRTFSKSPLPPTSARRGLPQLRNSFSCAFLCGQPSAQQRRTKNRPRGARGRVRLNSVHRKQRWLAPAQPPTHARTGGWATSPARPRTNRGECFEA